MLGLSVYFLFSFSNFQDLENMYWEESTLGATMFSLLQKRLKMSMCCFQFWTCFWKYFQRKCFLNFKQTYFHSYFLFSSKMETENTKTKCHLIFLFLFLCFIIILSKNSELNIVRNSPIQKEHISFTKVKKSNTSPIPIFLVQSHDNIKN